MYRCNFKNVSYSVFEFCCQCMLSQALRTLLVITFIAQLASLFVVILITE